MGSLSQVTEEQKCGEITFVQGRSDKRRAPPQGGVDAAGRGGVKGHTPPDMNIYNGSGFLLHRPPPGSLPSPARLQ